MNHTVIPSGPKLGCRLRSLVYVLLTALSFALAATDASAQTIAFEEDFEGISSPNAESALITEREAGTFQANAVTPGWTQTGATGQFIKFNGDSGNTAFLLNEAGTDRNTISREISGLTVGAEYKISFEYWGDNYGSYGYSFEWEIAGDVILIEEDPFVLNSGNFNTSSHTFTAITPATTLRFTETSYVAASPVFDNIVIEQLSFPEVTDLEPLAYYPLDGSGEEASGNNIDLGPVGDPAYVDSSAPGLGSALSVDGVDDALVGAGYVPSLTGQLTLSAWVLAESRTTWASIFKNWNGQFHLGLDSSNGRLSNYINLDGVSGQPNVVAPLVFPLQEWKHTVVVIDSTNRTQILYIDGAHVATNTFTADLQSSPCTGLGIAVKSRCDGTDAVPGFDAGYWHGQIDEVAAWDLALSGAQVADLYNLGLSGTPLIVLNQPPVADAGVSVEVPVGQYTVINGQASTDDSTPTAELDFQWTLVSAPSGSTSALSNAEYPVSYLRPDMPGTYVIELVVTDADGAQSAADSMQILAGIEPTVVFTPIYTGDQFYSRESDNYYSMGDMLYMLDSRDGQAIFERATWLYDYDFTNNSYVQNDRVEQLYTFDGAVLTSELTAEPNHPSAPYRWFNRAGIIDADNFRFEALYRDPETSQSRYGVLQFDGQDATLFEDFYGSVEGYQLYSLGYRTNKQFTLFRGIGSECLQYRTYTYPDGRTHEYCAVRSQAIFRKADSGFELILDHTQVPTGPGEIVTWFVESEQLANGDVVFIAQVRRSDDTSENRLYRFSGGSFAESLIDPTQFGPDEKFWVYNFLVDPTEILIDGYLRDDSTRDYQRGLFKTDSGLLTPFLTSKNSPVYPYGNFLNGPIGIAFYGSGWGGPGAYWLEDGLVRKLATRSDPVNGTIYDYVNPDWGQTTTLFDDRSVLIRAGNRLNFSYTEEPYSYESSYEYTALLARIDSDHDSIGDDVDNCPRRPNEDQADVDGNGVGDVCEDSDADSVPDVVDNCPSDRNPLQTNSDDDRFGDACDVCPFLTSDNQSDLNDDGEGDECDDDADGDSVLNVVDNCPLVANNQSNIDNDSEGDACDPDMDGDGIDNDIDLERIIVNGFILLNDLSRIPSSSFSDERQGGGSFGNVISAGGLSLQISDAAASEDGVQVTAIDGSGQARINQCDYQGRDATVDVLQGTSIIISCGSIGVQTLFGNAFLILDDEILVDVPSGSGARLLDTGSSNVLVQTEQQIAGLVTIVLDEQTTVSMSGSSLAVISEETVGRFVVENDPTSQEPIVVEKNGEVLEYEPGDKGQLVAIDIKPGSDDNAINLGSNGVVPVAILSDASFDATDVDPLTVRLASSEVRLKGKGTPAYQINDVNGDGLDDLVVQVETENLVMAPTDSTAKLTGSNFAGIEFIGEDAVTIVPLE